MSAAKPRIIDRIDAAPANYRLAGAAAAAFSGSNMKTSPVLFVLASAVCALLFAGCQHRSPQAGTVAGVFELQSVDGKPLPADVSHQGRPLTVVSGRMTFEPDGNCRSETVFRPGAGKEVKRQVAAVCTQQGSKLEMRWKGAGRTAGVIEGDTFTMNNEGMIFRYRKAP
jgi:hypothetical protein